MVSKGVSLDIVGLLKRLTGTERETHPVQPPGQ